MARFIVAFVRHGEYQQPPGVPSAHLPYPLTPGGMKQASEAAERLLTVAAKENWNIDPVIDSSCQLRGWQTASIIAGELTGSEREQQADSGPIVESFEQLAERCLGSAANLTVEQIESIVEADPRYDSLPAGWKSGSYFRLPLQGAESLMQAGERVKQHVTQRADSLERELSVDTLKVFVGHGAAFRHAAVHMGLLTTEQAVALSMYHCQPIFIERLQENRWQHIAGEWKIRKVKGLDLD